MALSDLLREELTLEEALARSTILGGLVIRDYSPDLIVGIVSGGILPAREISRIGGIAYAQITIRRPSCSRETYASTPKLLKPLMKLFYECLWMATDPMLIEEGEFNCQGMNVLVVDDVVHTGKTMGLATENLLKRGAEKIRTASINHVNGKRADYSLRKGRIKFPWSKNSREYERFRSYLIETPHLIRPS
ncbi:MAG: phosphoribosyltransferase family protein [Nanoarchaeota archaeon]